MARGSDREVKFLLDGAENSGFKAAEREVEVADLRDWKVIFVLVASFGGFSDRWAARVGEAENFGDLVETFANGVVASSADDIEMVVTLHVDDLSVAARNNGGEKREFWLMAAEPVGIDMGFEVVSGVKRLVVEDGFGAGGEGANK